MLVGTTLVVQSSLKLETEKWKFKDLENSDFFQELHEGACSKVLNMEVILRLSTQE